ncbi:hypothetical protein M422DRAFT_257394 [Sphaerobolus stellatus SS14]|uniref:Uncharacterized protein n=1 Tax=Sphaerobolus stellatus (strain SS14) TaxID=990650 RepID=A0A0C9U9N9_SPHS4|nr:hypothetical protein M422DRAFT_257394 [Sphaerobolus stellatus SS14]
MHIAARITNAGVAFALLSRYMHVIPIYLIPRARDILPHSDTLAPLSFSDPVHIALPPIPVV